MKRNGLLTAAAAILALSICLATGCDDRQTDSNARSSARSASKAYDRGRQVTNEAAHTGKTWTKSFADEWRKVRGTKP